MIFLAQPRLLCTLEVESVTFDMTEQRFPEEESIAQTRSSSSSSLSSPTITSRRGEGRAAKRGETRARARKRSTWVDSPYADSFTSTSEEEYSGEGEEGEKEEGWWSYNNDSAAEYNSQKALFLRITRKRWRSTDNGSGENDSKKREEEEETALPRDLWISRVHSKVQSINCTHSSCRLHFLLLFLPLTCAYHTPNPTSVSICNLYFSFFTHPSVVFRTCPAASARFTINAAISAAGRPLGRGFQHF